MTSNIQQLDPVQGLIDYIQDIKPYHTKVVEVLTEYVYNELIDTTITERFESSMEMIYPSPEQADDILAVCGFGGGNPWDGFTAWPVIPENVTLVLGPFDDTPAGYDIVVDTVKIPGDRTQQYLVGRDITIDLYAVDTVLDTRTVGVQTAYTVLATEFVTFGQIGGVANTQHTLLTVSGLLDPAVALPLLGPNEVYAAGVNFDPYPIDSVVGYSSASPVFYIDVPPGVDPLPTPTVGSLSQTPDENPGALVFSNSFVLLGDYATVFPQGFTLKVIGGTTEGEYTVKYAYYDSVGDKTYIRVVEEIDTVGFVTGDIHERFFGYDECALDQSNVPVGLTNTQMVENLVFSWSLPAETDVIDGYQYFIKEAEHNVTSEFKINGDATGDIFAADEIRVTGSQNNDKVHTVLNITLDTYYNIAQSQNEIDYSNVLPNGTFVAGDGVGGTAYVALDTITLSDGSVVTVNEVDIDGDVIRFTVTIASLLIITAGDVLTQTSTSGTGLGFTLTVQSANLIPTEYTLITVVVDPTIETQTGLAKYRLQNNQSEQDYDAQTLLEDQNELSYSTFVGGDGVGGTAYAATETITLSDGSLITVDAVDVNGDVTEFTVTTSGNTIVSLGVALTQTITSGTGTLFTLTPELLNVGSLLNGSFVGGTGFLNTTPAVLPLVLPTGGDAGNTITVNGVFMLRINEVIGGTVTDFGVVSVDGSSIVHGTALLQTATTGAGTGFTLTPEDANTVVRSRGWVEKYTP